MSSWFCPKTSMSKLHPQFKWLLDFGYCSERELIESWIKDFPIKDGLEKTINEFQTTFRSTFWELYLNQVIRHSCLEVDLNFDSPDFLIKKDDKIVSIEAVVANFPEHAASEEDRTFKDVYDDNDIYEIINESIPRILSAISYKSKKYFSHYLNNDLVNSNPFIISVADFGQINYGQVAFYSVLSVLYNAAYDPEDKLDLKILCNDNYGNEYKYISSYKKDNGTELSLGLFADDQYKHISALLFTCTLTLGKLTSLTNNHSLSKFIILEREHFKTIRYSGSQTDETLCDGLFLFINPYADYPVDNGFFKGKGLTMITADFKDDYEISIECENNSPLIRRKVGMKGEEQYLKDIEDFTFYPV